MIGTTWGLVHGSRLERGLTADVFTISEAVDPEETFGGVDGNCAITSKVGRGSPRMPDLHRQIPAASSVANSSTIRLSNAPRS
jgi:hypothetical protein